MRLLVLTISDRAFKGIYEDLSGPAVESVLKTFDQSWEVKRTIVPDERDAILNEFHKSIGFFDIILTSGGTGLSRRDTTPEATIEFCDRMVPGIAELLRHESCAQTKNAPLSRGVAGTKENMLIVNFPGSEKAARFCAGVVAPLLDHAFKMMHGEGH